mmetsp:Transcript_50986/g.58477  ORF Transcript_50986/g.58477 Transcript_50986/m.58477 type:complete len:517 (+) Transcript_50986:1-1551(+)
MFLKDLFNLLADSDIEIKRAVDKCLADFLKEIKDSEYHFDDYAPSTLMSILVEICADNQKDRKLCRSVALEWISDFLSMYFTQRSSAKFQFSDNGDQKYKLFGTTDTEMKLYSKFEFSDFDFKCIESNFGELLEVNFLCLNDMEEDIRNLTQGCNDLLLRLVEEGMTPSDIVKDMIRRLLQRGESDRNKKAVLKWIEMFLNSYSDEMVTFMDDVFAKLSKKLADPNSELVDLTLQILGRMSVYKDYFHRIIERLLQEFCDDRELLINRGNSIFKKLCLVLDPKQVFEMSARALILYTDSNFVSDMVQTLDILLLTEGDLYDLRCMLKESKFSDKNTGIKFFETLQEAWIYNPISTITLSLLAQQYELSFVVIQIFSEVEIQKEHLVQLGRLVLLLESPVFAYLRLQMLDHQNHPFLLKSLYGILMLLPLSKSYYSLRSRLRALANVDFSDNNVSIHKYNKKVRKPKQHVDLEAIASRFEHVHKEDNLWIRRNRLEQDIRPDRTSTMFLKTQEPEVD